MKMIRVRIVILASWLFSLFVLGGLLSSLKMSNIAIWSIFLILVFTLVIPRISRDFAWPIILAPITALIVVKAATRGFLDNMVIFMTVVEVVAIVVTMLLARWVSQALDEFVSAVTFITLGKHDPRIESTFSGEGLIYREVRRARNHQRHLALISIGIDEKSIEPTVDKLVQEIQRTMVKQYKLRRLSTMLCDELEDCAIIVQEHDHFLAVLPDTQPEEMATVVERLRQKASSTDSVGIKIGVANMSHDSFTFDGLVAKATQDMKNDGVVQQSEMLKQYPVEN